VLQDQQAQNHFGREASPAAPATVGVALRQCLVDRGNNRIIRQDRIDVWHPSLMQIFDLCRNQSITEAALLASRLDHADRLGTALYLSSIMHARVHNHAASFLTKMLYPPLQSLRWYESIVPHPSHSGAFVQLPTHQGCTSSSYAPPILRRKVASFCRESQFCG
jgi:hypothetical protein